MYLQKSFVDTRKKSSSKGQLQTNDAAQFHTFTFRCRNNYKYFLITNVDGSEQNRILSEALLDRLHTATVGIYRFTVRILPAGRIASENDQAFRTFAALVFAGDRVCGGLRDPASDKGGLAECHLAFGAHHADHILIGGVGVCAAGRISADRCQCCREAYNGIPHLSDLISGHGTFIQVAADEG